MEKTITTADIMAMESMVRRNFVNTLSGIKSAQLLGTISEEGIDNLGTFNSLVHIGANPPLLGFIMRPLTVNRQTYNNIKNNGHYTLNQIHEQIVAPAHQCSAKYAPEVSEFDATGLTPQRSESLKAPYVKEAFIKIGLEYIEEYPIKANGTILIIGKVLEVKIPETAIEESGHVDLAAWQGVGVSGLDTYYKQEKMLRLPFARP